MLRKYLVLIHELNRLNIAILRVSETWWPVSGECDTENKRFYYSDNNDKGVGIIVTKEIAEIIPYSDRTIQLKFLENPSTSA